MADKGSGFLVSKEAYTDFQLRVEFWVDEDANSGIFIRCTIPDKIGTDSATLVIISLTPVRMLADRVRSS